MRKLIFILALLSASLSYGQVIVGETNTKTRIHGNIGISSKTELSRFVTNKSDTAYMLTYQNMEYLYLVDYEIITLPYDDMIQLMYTLVDIHTSIGYGDRKRIYLSDYTLYVRKSRNGFGFPLLEVYVNSNRGDSMFCIKERECIQIIRALELE